MQNRWLQTSIEVAIYFHRTIYKRKLLYSRNLGASNSIASHSTFVVLWLSSNALYGTHFGSERREGVDGHCPNSFIYINVNTQIICGVRIVHVIRITTY